MNKEIIIGDRKIFYRVTGEGQPIVMLHGIPADGNIWRNQFRALPFKFIIPDLPGSGKSEVINDMSMEGMAEVIKSILDAEEPPLTPPKGENNTQPSLNEDAVNKSNVSESEVSEMVASPFGGSRKGAVLIGHSMGGYISLAFAEKYPGYLKGLGLFHSTAYPDTEEKKEARRKGIEFIKEHSAFEFLKTSTYKLFSQQSKEEIPQLIDEFMAGLHNFRADALVSYYKAMMHRPDRRTILKNQEIPMLFIAGKHDTAIPVNDILEQCHLPEISYFHILAKSGHMGMLEEAEKINAILNDYLINLS